MPQGPAIDPGTTTSGTGTEKGRETETDIGIGTVTETETAIETTGTETTAAETLTERDATTGGMTAGGPALVIVHPHRLDLQHKVLRHSLRPRRTTKSRLNELNLKHGKGSVMQRKPSMKQRRKPWLSQGKRYQVSFVFSLRIDMVS